MAILASVASAQFYDGFDDNYIGDWDQRCQPASWSVSSGLVQATSDYNCSSLIAPGQIIAQDVIMTTSAKGVHAFGLLSRLDSGDNGIYAYVAPDANVARIRQVIAGQASTVLTSLSASFPDGIWYEMTLTCEGPALHFVIYAPSTGQTWTLDATDPGPHPGEFGIVTGDEPLALWDYLECECTIPVSAELVAETVDDDATGQSAGDGDGAFEAGEQVEVMFGLENTSTIDMTNVYAVLQSLSGDITVIGNYQQFGTIAPGETQMSLGSYVLSAQPFAEMQVTYPVRLTVFADGGYSEQTDFEIPLGYGISCDLEVPPDEWTNSPMLGGWGDNWGVSPLRNHTSGGARSFKCGDFGSGDYDNHLFCGETSPWFNVPHDGTLTFWMWTDIQTYTTDALLALDGGLIQIGQFDNWDTPVPSGGYPYEIAASPTGPFPAGTGVFSGIYGWQMVTCSFTAEQSGPHMLRFVFGSDDAGTREGWYIDDISVTGPTGIDPDGSSEYLIPLSVTAAPNPFSDMVLLQLQGTNAGSTTIDVFDLAGRNVMEISPATAAGSWTAVWDGFDRDGSQLPAGCYVARCTNEAGETLNLRMVKTE
jgi:hypothetical protein